MYRIADFYAGVGGISAGFKKTGKTETVFAVDIEPKCKITYDLNSDVKQTTMDICKLNIDDIPDFDILCAGFNCQPFSIAGKQKGFSDKRTNSLKTLFEIIKRKKPKCVFFENVKGLLTHDGGKSFKKVLKKLEKSGMTSIYYKLLNTSEYTKIPQNRERIFIVVRKHVLIHFH
jgi:DNA (cytosine-5)-methyltransferase 1|uniref:DNA (cytosine-5-)-methyltransferase n=1 Tax=viral metagenome TaxID=1070528 RepID=A0A6C0IZB7_9ZZZZ